jgi:AbrB family looped-hinge helix DNA binding protein
MARTVFRTEVRAKGQLTIPAPVRQRARLKDGDLVEIEVTSKGILLRPLRTIDATQAWFWTPGWQAGEREASSDIEARRTTRFGNAKEFLASLKAKRR